VNVGLSDLFRNAHGASGQCLAGAGEARGSCGKGRGADPQFRQGGPRPDALILRIIIGRVVDERDFQCLDVMAQVGAALVQERADDGKPGAEGGARRRPLRIGDGGGAPT
jgi:hypothetical protein